MSLSFANLAVLTALAAMAIPPIIHLLNRRRYEVVDWGAMQFLQVRQSTQRRVLWEDLLLMLLRMALIGLLVLGLAGPEIGSSFLAGLGDGSQRDVVLVLDASASMSYDDSSGKNPFQAAREWTTTFIKGLKGGDRLAILQAQQQALPIVELTGDFAFVKERLADLKPPAGACRWPMAVEEALRILSKSVSSNQQIILVGDEQRFGFADPETLSGWKQIAGNTSLSPKVIFISVKPSLSRSNYSLAPIHVGRAAPWVGQLIRFTTALKLDGFKEYQAPHRVRLEVDGKHVQDVAIPIGVSGQAQIPFSFQHKFTSPGVHLVSIVVEPEPPPAERKPKYQLRDCIPADNRQDIALEVLPSLPVLIVDGGDAGQPESSSYFLHKALSFSPAGTRSGVQPQVLSLKGFEADSSVLHKTKPRVVLLADVSKFSAASERALAAFLAEGGGVFVILGQRAQADYYNDKLFAAGKGWLPAKLVESPGNVSGTPAALDPRTALHPALEVFREQNSTLQTVKFPRWWKISSSVQKEFVGASLSDGSPWLVEKAFGKGRVLLCTTPLDRSWGSDLPTRWEYPVLVHELVYHLAKARAAELNVEPGQPIRFAPDVPPALPVDAVVIPPSREPKQVRLESWPLEIETRQVGVYRMEAGNRALAYFVAKPDTRESDLASCTDEDWNRLRKVLPIERVESGSEIGSSGSDQPTAELWWLFFVSVILLLCAEVWMTRRMALARSST